MTYQEAEQSRVRRQHSRDAIALAMKGEWREAITVNKRIVEMFPDDVEALNRLGRAHMELAEYDGAEEAYRKALALDSYNGIAQKNLQRLAHLKKSKTTQQAGTHRLDPQYFIEDIGKAGVVQLREMATPEVLARVVAGDVVQLKAQGTDMAVETPQGEYLGRVDPRHGQRLVRLMKGGNRYSAAVVSSTERTVSVIIRETRQHPSLVGQMSFPTRGVEGVRSDLSDRVIRREIEQEESLTGDPGYTVVGGEETEVLAEDRSSSDDYEEDSEN